MSIKFKGHDYLIGPALKFGIQSVFNGDCVGSVFYANQQCTVIMSTVGDLYLKVQYLNTEWPAIHPLKTMSELLEGWS